MLKALNHRSDGAGRMGILKAARPALPTHRHLPAAIAPIK
jgi:hypothetical protein